MKTTIWTYPWDFIDDGPEKCLETIRERTGIGGVSLAASYHAGSFVLPHNPKRKVYFPEDGVVYFEPDLKLYGTIKPHVSRLVDEIDPLRALEAAAPRYDMTVTAWTVLLHNSRIGTMYPEYTMRNAYGDHLIFALCPSREPAREYALALVNDLANNQALDVIELETFEFMGYLHGFHHEKASIEITPTADFLLGLCFCDACRDRAEKEKVDFEAVRDAVAGRLEKFFERPEAERPLSEELDKLDRETDGEFNAYLQVRMETVHSLLNEMKFIAMGRTRLRPMLEYPPEVSPLYGIDFSRLKTIADEVTILDYLAGVDEVIQYAEGYSAALPEDIGMVVGLNGGHPFVDGPENIKAKIKGLQKSGFQALSFYNYGFLRLENLDWIREALAGL